MDRSIFCFVLMPFRDEFNDIYTLGIKEAVASCGMLAQRVDEQTFHNETILSRIYNQIQSADIIIADMTSQNANVFYEVGYAHAKNKPCILLTQNVNDIPFDLKHHRHIVYGNSIANLRQALVSDLTSLRKALADERSPISVSLKTCFGFLSKQHGVAVADLKAEFDINNYGDAPIEIDTIYIYTGDRWNLKQDGKQCLKGAANRKPYTRRHIVQSPIARLQSNTWSLLSINMDKVVAATHLGESLEDKYTLTGTILVQLVTNSGTFDFPVHVQVTVDDDIPF